MSGLFDKSGTGAFTAGTTSVNDNDIVKGEFDTLNAADLLSSLEAGPELVDLPESSVFGAFSDDPMMGTSSGFLEEFTDLSNFVLGEGTLDFDTVVALPTEPEEVVMATTSGLKRTASDASLDDVPPPNPDHNDYTSKAKRLRMPSSTESETDDAALGVKAADKYTERRRKNNVASRRSRETRKQKFVAMEEQAAQLTISNRELRKKVEELEKMTKKMKEILVQRLAHGTK